MRHLSLLAALMTAGTAQAATFLEVGELVSRDFRPWEKRHDLSDGGRLERNGVEISMSRSERGKVTEYFLRVANNGASTALLRIGVAHDAGKSGGIFWDGLDCHANMLRSTAPKTDKYNFPAAAYLDGGRLSAVGFAPQTVSSRFERRCDIDGDRATLRFESFLALHPGDEDSIVFVSQEADGAVSHVEAVENIYNAYPDHFRPVRGADQRLYGVGGYFFSSDTNRDYQLEEARRFGFSWEWYYNCYQKAGDIFPDPGLWDASKGYKTEKAHAACDTPGSVEDWIAYNKRRIQAGSRTSAMFFYYLQQYCNSDLLKTVYKDSMWINAKGAGQAKSHGWAEEGYAEYAWPGETSSYGAALRKDLGKVWETFDVSGFSLDCTMGATPYYGPLAAREKGKAFDNEGRIFALEGVAIARNIDFTHALPPKPDGRVPASITNDPNYYLSTFHCDAAMHEMPPFDRVESILPKRLQLGQKPYYWWKGFRIDPLLRWKELTKDERDEGLSGVVNYVTLASLRFGAVPPVFFEHGFPDMIEWRDTFVTLQRAGWRAAPFAWVDGVSGPENPWSEDAKIWVSRFGGADESFVVLSIPSPEGMRGKLRIRTGKFGAGGAVYADIRGTPTSNTVSKTETIVEFDLKKHAPLVLRKITDKKEGEIIAQIKRLPNGDSILEAREKNNAPAFSMTEKAPFHFQPENGAWVGGMKLAEGNKIVAAIAGDPAELDKLGHMVRNLEVYYEYFKGRSAAPLPRLWGMDKIWKPSLRIPVMAPDASELAERKTIFALGESARKQFFPGVKETDTILRGEKDGQTVVGFFPGKTSEEKLVECFLAKLDDTYPFHGGISGQWAVDCGLSGKTFRKR